jgi:hypothetical protein
LVTKLFLSGGLIRLRSGNIVVLSEVWHEIVDWMRLWWGLTPGEEWLSLDLGIKLNILLWEIPHTKFRLLFGQMVE